MATPIPENSIIVDLTDTYGSMLVGGFLSCIIWGVSSLQVFLYFAMYEADPWTKKAMVTFLWVLDCVNQIVVLKSLWPVLIKHYGSIHGLGEIQRELTHHAWVAQLLEFTVQMYFIHRIYKFSGKRWLFPVAMIALSVFQLVILIPYDIMTYAGGPTVAKLSTHTAIAEVISLRAVTAGEDILLAGAMLYLVLKDGLPHFQRSRRMVIRIAVITVNTGLWTAIVALVELILVAVYPNGLQFCIVEFPLCSLYFSSLLASLNSRDYVKGTTSTRPSDDTPMNWATPKRGDSEALYLDALGKGGRSTASAMTESTAKVYGIDSQDKDRGKTLV